MCALWRGLLGLYLALLCAAGQNCADHSLRAELERQEERLARAQSLFPDANLDVGARVFAQRCSACHGRDGRGAMAVPPLRGHVAQLTATPLGRKYAAGVVVHGIHGVLEVDAKKFSSMMPGLGSQLDDEAIAGALNFAALVVNDRDLLEHAPVTTLDVQHERKQRRTPQEHLARRPSLLPRATTDAWVRELQQPQSR